MYVSQPSGPNQRRTSCTNFLTLVGLVLLAGLAACNGDAVSGPGYICDVTNPVADVFIDLPTNTLFVHSPPQESDFLRMTARATNRFGSTRTDVPIKFVSSDTTIATVD